MILLGKIKKKTSDGILLLTMDSNAAVITIPVKFPKGMMILLADDAEGTFLGVDGDLKETPNGVTMDGKNVAVLKSKKAPK